MKYLKFIRTFFRLLGTQNVCEFSDGRCEPEKHVWKTRIGFLTAAKVAKILHL